MRNERTNIPPRGGSSAVGQHKQPARDERLPRWDRPLDLRQHPPLNMAPIEPIDWSKYVSSRMNAYEQAW